MPSEEIGKYLSRSWAAINVVGLLDPQAGEKLTSFKDLASFGGFKGKD